MLPGTRTVLTCEQFSKILALYPFGSRFHIPLLLGWNCGLRINECFGLTWDDVDFDAKTISLLIRRAQCRNVLSEVIFPFSSTQRSGNLDTWAAEDFAVCSTGGKAVAKCYFLFLKPP